VQVNEINKILNRRPDEMPDVKS